MTCPHCQNAMEPGEVSFRQPAGSWLILGPAAMELQFVEQEGDRQIDLGVSNNHSPSRSNPDFRCRTCGLVVVSSR